MQADDVNLGVRLQLLGLDFTCLLSARQQKADADM